MKVWAAKDTYQKLLPTIYQFWHTYGSDIQSGAVVLSAIAAFAIIRSTRQNGRRRNTMDLILHQESDRDLIEARAAFNELKAGEVKLATYAKPETKNSEQAQTIRKILNLHELTAVAIEEGVIDERVYRRWFNTTYIKDYVAVEAYILEARRTYENPKAFCEFEKMAKRWKSDKSWYAKPSWLQRKSEAFARLRRA
ncbi:DUF4760 domain-containing protein [Erythrobacter sp. SDW2]|uniref:DUF4760 domain-containing protein n=1 Tax=Erythrobacter sp. SDW2 TaxID=2907154 RepID=UPI001F19B8AB|nr:DUF4760 domain-containing protein [Erythrobacter sp. SDW2]UIP07129.1 DUF4760 domain-containing protein [Erythrobacter sp. SDW2]